MGGPDEYVTMDDLFAVSGETESDGTLTDIVFIFGSPLDVVHIWTKYLHRDRTAHPSMRHTDGPTPESGGNGA
jgi:hypothetical protein